jgi:GR25 family glycosyltransferase involved in LPS biosynthesis
MTPLQNTALYYINCKKHTERLETFKQNLEIIGMAGTKQTCVDGSKFTPKKLCNMISNGTLDCNADMTPIEVAIAMSYLKVYKRIAKSKKKYAIILEDDIKVKVNFTKDIERILNTLEEHDKKFDVLYLWNGNFASTKTKLKKQIVLNKRLTVFSETLPHNAGNSAFIVTREFAKYMLQKNTKIKYPLDMFMGYSTPGKIKMTIGMKTSKGCYISPLVSLGCGGDAGTGKTTQNYDAPNIKSICKKC